MRLHRFYIPEPIGSKKAVVVDSEALARQLAKVFRLKLGDNVKLFDGSGNDYVCRIEKNNGKSISFSIEAEESSPFIPTRDICLCVALVKKDTFEWIVQKATELGVTKIIPIIADRSEKKGLNEERLKRIAIEASEQSGRGTIPKIHPIIDVENSVNFLGTVPVQDRPKALVFHLEGNALMNGDFEGTYPIEIFIGPEGGWSPKEMALFHEHSMMIRRLGPQVLRAETAAIAALSRVALV